MTREEIVEVMARGMCAAGKNRPDQRSAFTPLATAALDALEAAGLRVVPGEASASMCEAGSVGPMEVEPGLPAITTSQADAAYRAMVAAARAEE